MPPKCFKCGIDASVGDVAIWDNDHFLWVRDSTSQWQDSTGTWTKLPNAIWSRADFEACNVYCKSCWMNWAPWDGEVDTALKITTEEIQETNQTNQAQTNQANQLCSELGNSNFELRWEFLVTNEPDEEWQLMSEEMNDALEKRWAQGWHGDNGKLGGIISFFFCERDFTCMSEEDMKR